jgi:hypothetical protein
MSVGAGLGIIGRPQQGRATVANPEHVKRLKQDIEAWNAARPND